MYTDLQVEPASLTAAASILCVSFQTLCEEQFSWPGVF